MKHNRINDLRITKDKDLSRMLIVTVVIFVAMAALRPNLFLTGANFTSIANLLEIADGAVVGTYFKIDGKFENQVDVDRVKEFMGVVHQFRDRS